jgi:hypothetical protein
MSWRWLTRGGADRALSSHVGRIRSGLHQSPTTTWAAEWDEGEMANFSAANCWERDNSTTTRTEQRVLAYPTLNPDDLISPKGTSAAIYVRVLSVEWDKHWLTWWIPEPAAGSSLTLTVTGQYVTHTAPKIGGTDFMELFRRQLAHYVAT